MRRNQILSHIFHWSKKRWDEYWAWKIEMKIAFLTLLVTCGIGFIANSIAENQTQIMTMQNKLQKQFMDFEERKFGSEIAKKSEDDANKLFDLAMSGDKTTFQNVYDLVKDGHQVENLKSLDWFVSEFENIGRLYCNGEMRDNDLRGVLKEVIHPVCGNEQIFNRYQNTKSGLSGLCSKLFPGSTVMAKYANPDKCPALRE